MGMDFLTPMWAPGTDLDDCPDTVETETEDYAPIFEFVDGSTITIFECEDPEIFELEPDSMASQVKEIIEYNTFSLTESKKLLENCMFTKPRPVYCTVYSNPGLCKWKNCQTCDYKSK